MKRFTSLMCLLAMTFLFFTTGYAEGIVYPHEEVETKVTSNEGTQKSIHSGRIWKTIFGEALREDMEHGELRYTVYLPENYDNKKEYPFLLYLHGGSMGYRRSGGKTPWEMDLDGSWQYAESIANSIESCIIFVPQAPGTKENYEDKNAYWSGISPDEILSGATVNKSNSSPYLRATEKMMSDFLEKGISYGGNVFKIDKSRLYLTGHSQGAVGAYAILKDCPDVFAAAIIGAGIGDPDAADSWKDTPVRIFHGTSDPKVTYKAAEAMAEALKDHPGAEIITLEGEGHDIKPYMYGVTGNGEAGETLMWMAKQDRDKFESTSIIAFILIAVLILAAGVAAFWGIKKVKTVKQ